MPLPFPPPLSRNLGPARRQAPLVAISGLSVHLRVRVCSDHSDGFRWMQPSRRRSAFARAGADGHHWAQLCAGSPHLCCGMRSPPPFAVLSSARDHGNAPFSRMWKSVAESSDCCHQHVKGAGMILATDKVRSSPLPPPDLPVLVLHCDGNPRPRSRLDAWAASLTGIGRVRRRKCERLLEVAHAGYGLQLGGHRYLLASRSHWRHVC